MRIGIDARFLTHPQQGGFKTYTQNIVQGLAALDSENEYILYTDRPAPDQTPPGKNFRIRPVLGPAALREQLILPLMMSRDRVDVAHFPSNTGPIAAPCPVVLTIHDVIPCISDFGFRISEFGVRNSAIRNPHSALRNARSWALGRYWETLIPRAARAARHIVTVSECSKRDICRLLGVPDQRITVVPTGLHPDFGSGEPAADALEVRANYRLPERFILGFASSDPRKNFERLLAATHIVAGELPDVGLVLICASDRARSTALDAVLQWEDPQAQLVLLDPVPRADLAAIYRAAEVLAFPSLYEGFGLPMIEAMACGTPVVTSNVSSLPEVAGDAALLVDPLEPQEIAAALIRVMTDRVLRTELTARGVTRATSFGWERTARETLAVYARVRAESVTPTPVRAAGGRALRGGAR